MPGLWSIHPRPPCCRYARLLSIHPPRCGYARPVVDTSASCRYTCPVVDTPAPLLIHLACARYTRLAVDTPALLSICRPPVDTCPVADTPAPLWIRPPCCRYVRLDMPTLWSIYPPPVDTPAALSIDLRLLPLLWAVVLQMTWQGARMPTSLKEGRGKE